MQNRQKILGFERYMIAVAGRRKVRRTEPLVVEASGIWPEHFVVDGHHVGSAYFPTPTAPCLVARRLIYNQLVRNPGRTEISLLTVTPSRVDVAIREEPLR